MSSDLASPLLISVLVHLLEFSVLSVIGGALWRQAPPLDRSITELVLTPPAPVAVAPVPQPDRSPIAPPTLKTISTPISVTPIQAVQLPPVTPPERKQLPSPKPVRKAPLRLAQAPSHAKRPPKPQTRRPDFALPVSAPTVPKPGPPLPLPIENPTPPDNVLGPPAQQAAQTPPPVLAEGAEAGTGEFFERGDAGIVPGESASGGGSGSVGLGSGGSESNQRLAGLQPGAGGTGLGGGVGPLARPLGSYQTKPHYPGLPDDRVLKVRPSSKSM